MKPIVLYNDPEFSARFFKLAIPLAIQSLLSSSVTFLDTLMIGQLGETAIAAVGLGNQLFFFSSLFFFGLSSGISILIAQFWGKNDLAMIHRIMGLGYTIAITGSLIFTTIALTIPEVVLRLFTADQEVIRQGAVYLRTVGISYLIVAPCFVIDATFKSTESMKISSIVAGITIIINCLGNSLLIFGLGPFPELGIQGAAIATVIARCVQLSLLLLVSYRGKGHATKASLSALMHYHKPLVKRFVAVSLPVLAHEMVWSLGMVVYNMVLARMGTDIIASVNVANGLWNLFFIIAISIAHSSAVLIGKELGGGDIERTHVLGRRFLQMSFFSGFILMGFVILCSFILPHLVDVSPQSRQYIQQIVLIRAFCLPIVSCNITLFISILRSGGDTKMAFLIENSVLWLWGVPAIILCGLVLKLPLMVVMMVIVIEEIIKMSLGFWRVKSDKWANNLTELEAH